MRLPENGAREADADARTAALLLAIDPAGLHGAIVRGTSRAACEQWLDGYTQLLPVAAPTKRIPINISEERLLGGLDFAATIASGHAVSERGVLALADGGCVVLSAETTRATTWAQITRALDDQAVTVERDSLSETHAARFAAIAMEPTDDDRCAPAFADRVALIVELTATTRALWKDFPDHAAVRAAAARLSTVQCSDAMLVALSEGASRLGISSCRIVLLALAAARASAAWNHRNDINADDLTCSARLVFAGRATMSGEQDAATDDLAEANSHSETPENLPEQTPGPDPNPEANERSEPPPVERTEIERYAALADAELASESNSSQESHTEIRAMTDMVIHAALSALPAGMLAAAAARAGHRKGNAGRSGAELTGGNRGRQIGVRRGDPRGGARLDLVATLRAAVPMQRLRRAARTAGETRLVELRRDDFRVRRCATPATTTTLFVVDASGSAALHRLAEAKGAIELMLAEGYARRDRVAVIAFRGTTAELVLPATHALARARRAVSGMPAGGGTPLATALDLAATVMTTLRRDSSAVVTVILTDGRANVGRDGKGGRPRAEADALDAAKRFSSVAGDVVWIDTSTRSEPLSRKLAEALRARYLLLPQPNARGLSNVARAAHLRGEAVQQSPTQRRADA